MRYIIRLTDVDGYNSVVASDEEIYFESDNPEPMRFSSFDEALEALRTYSDFHGFGEHQEVSIVKVR